MEDPDVSVKKSWTLLPLAIVGVLGLVVVSAWGVLKFTTGPGQTNEKEKKRTATKDGNSSRAAEDSTALPKMIERLDPRDPEQAKLRKTAEELLSLPSPAESATLQDVRTHERKLSDLRSRIEELDDEV